MAEPAELQEQEAAARHLIITPTYKDPATGALYVHQDLIEQQLPWAEEEHIGSIKTEHAFGDVESFVAYGDNHILLLAAD